MRIAIFEENNFDIVFLDENMPGMSGLETLTEMKEKEQHSYDHDYKK
jgi:CheY-like chemotaxis protein